MFVRSKSIVDHHCSHEIFKWRMYVLLSLQ